MTFYSALLSFTACAALPVALAATQLPAPIPRDKEPPVQRRMQEKRMPLTVSGCVRGNRLRLFAPGSRDGTADILNTDELILEGSKDLMRQLRQEHEGHYDELIGIAFLQSVPDGSTTTDVESKPVGKKGRITIGVREGQGPTANLRQPVRFKVEGVRHLHVACVGY
jgi:hypothetical protein